MPQMRCMHGQLSLREESNSGLYATYDTSVSCLQLMIRTYVRMPYVRASTALIIVYSACPLCQGWHGRAAPTYNACVTQQYIYIYIPRYQRIVEDSTSMRAHFACAWAMTYFQIQPCMRVRIRSNACHGTLCQGWQSGSNIRSMMLRGRHQCAVCAALRLVDCRRARVRARDLYIYYHYVTYRPGACMGEHINGTPTLSLRCLA